MGVGRGVSVPSRSRRVRRKRLHLHLRRRKRRDRQRRSNVRDSVLSARMRRPISPSSIAGTCDSCCIPFLFFLRDYMRLFSLVLSFFSLRQLTWCISSYSVSSRHMAMCRGCSDLVMASSRECPLCRTRIVTEARLLRIFKT